MAEQVGAPEQILVRVSVDTYASLQLALPFEGRRSMQDLLSGVIDAYLADLLQRDDGYRQALDGLRESRATADGVLARRRAGAGGRRKLSSSS